MVVVIPVDDSKQAVAEWLLPWVCNGFRLAELTVRLLEGLSIDPPAGGFPESLKVGADSRFFEPQIFAEFDEGQLFRVPFARALRSNS